MKIKIFTTGGTIDKLYFDQLSEYQVGTPQIETFLREANVTFEFVVRSLLQKDSLELTDDDRELIRQAILQDDARQIVVTHGTDTMIETARRLRDVPEKTIVLTGAMKPACFRSTDAVLNIGFAVAAVQLLPPGVYIAMNGRLFDPDHARKDRQRYCFDTIADG
ncbi:MAG: asparaginase [Candidatus Nealsonbacteria bacterium]|nr:asparaginase [Candidatus Nealsonbacteria bacterium]